MKIQLKHTLAIICFGLVWLFGAQSVSAFTMNEVAKLLASDGAAADEFGFSISVSGDTAVVGAYQHDDNGVNSGSVYLYVRAGAKSGQSRPNCCPAMVLISTSSVLPFQ